MTGAPSSPAALLRTLEQQARPRVRALLAQHSGESRRQSLAIRVARRAMLLPIDHVREVLDAPRYVAAVPGTPRWLVGVASHRGELLPLDDLATLLFGDCTDYQRRGAALIVPGRQRILGLLVDEVVGLRRYRLRHAQDQDDIPEALGPLLLGLSDDAGGGLPLVDPSAVEQLPAFHDAAFAAGAG